MTESRRVLIVSDAWKPQVNGVVRTIAHTVRELEKMGHTVEVIGPERFRTFPLPSYPEIRIALWPKPGIAKAIDGFRPDAIHIATEGPLGKAARSICLRRGYAFTTAYHTQFPEYIHARLRVPLSWTYGILRRFHAASKAVMVATPSLDETLAARGFRKLVRWSRGVDVELFRPRSKDVYSFPRPILLYAGRVAIEKNIEAFLALDVPGTKVVIGRGPALDSLKAAYPEAKFLGFLDNGKLAAHFAAADVFVFPSRTDTFGLVLLEALASGIPVAAYPVTGPRDVITDQKIGALDEDLGAAVRRALGGDPAACRAHALAYSWEAAARQFLLNLAPLT
ncbi:MAG: glycosyltransferase family 1 protein [Alphaproteobacteria bacterium]|nr:glycosyltransferase family 1 protein [Alphaproteobacteria bacterium]